MQKDFVQQTLNRALTSHRSGDLNDAVKAYEEVIPYVSDSVKASLHGNVGAILNSQGSNEKAMFHFQSAVESDTKSSSAHFNLAVILTSKFELHKKALKHCLIALRLDPSNYKVLHLMGNIYQNIGRNEEAEKCFSSADKLVRENEDNKSQNIESDNSGEILHEKLIIMKMKEDEVLSFTIEGETYYLKCLSQKPLIVVVDNFLLPQECQHIMSAVQDSLTQSFVTGGGIGEDANAEPYRSSYNAWLPQDSTLSTIKTRLSALLGIPMSYLVQKSEDLQVVKYENGGQFKVHHDSSSFQKRFVTALLYLNDVSNGGETWFPFAAANRDSTEGIVSTEDAISRSLLEFNSKKAHNTLSGLKVAPRQGRMALFFNHNISGDLDPLAVHAGLPLSSNSCDNIADNLNGSNPLEKW
eukprot:CAMPEP_0170082868 /NCGR_PEP_ID=MMETSP0019_2-20121128/18325_1 /TAXON_ID=98059 /ORGANISM="Dinobryon sp., Strain UTEXLB2267" /LENGTH=411 /DNA_ID=CAMNT_0010297907 /DNA_START=124 /DNA_END=1356 /DNA_ORIENTATION=-